MVPACVKFFRVLVVTILSETQMVPRLVHQAIVQAGAIRHLLLVVLLQVLLPLVHRLQAEEAVVAEAAAVAEGEVNFLMLKSF